MSKGKPNSKIVARLIAVLVFWTTLFFWGIFVPRRVQYKTLWPIFSKLFLFGSKIRAHFIGSFDIRNEKNTIFAVNHRSFADTFIVTNFLRKPFTFTLISWMIREPVFKFLVTRMGLIPIVRDNVIEQKKSLKKILKMLKKEYSLIYFPEGGFFYDSPVGVLKKGIAKIAKESGCSVVPIVIYGAGFDKDFLYENDFKWRDVYVSSSSPLKYTDYETEEEFIAALKLRMEELYLSLEKKYKGIIC